MIKFDVSKLSIEIVQLKTVTTSLGGSITIVDEHKTTDAKEVVKRIPVPMAIARQFIQQTHKITKYLKPVLTALVKYDGHIVAMERHPLAALGKIEEEGLFGTKRWVPACEANINTYVKPLINASGHDWFFDGRYAYSFNGLSIERAVGEAFCMTADESFRKVDATTIDLQNLNDSNKIQPTQRSCMAFVASTGEMAVSPPIWKNLNDIGSSKLDKTADDDIDDDDDSVEVTVNNRFTFDTINEAFCVNLNFALKACQEIGQTFGYEYVEPMQLSRLMIELHTVNLPSISREVKQTYDVGIPFTHVLAWLLGMSRKANTLETYIMMRSLMKYLTKKGIFKADKFDVNNVFQLGQTVDSIPLITLAELMDKKNTDPFSFSDVLSKVSATMKAKRENSEVFAVGTLHNEE